MLLNWIVDLAVVVLALVAVVFGLLVIVMVDELRERRRVRDETDHVNRASLRLIYAMEQVPTGRRR